MRQAPPRTTAMRRALVVVANATHARLYTRNEEGEALLSVTALDAPLSRLRAGRAGGNEQRPGGAGLDPWRGGHLQFARRLGERIEQGLVDEHCDQLALFAGAPFLGELRDELGPAAQRALRAAVEVDLSALAPRELQTRVGSELGAHAAAR